MLILERPWTRQPQVPVGISRANALARGLVFSLNPAHGDVVAGGLPTYVGTAVRQPRKTGLAFVADDTANDAIAISAAAGLYGITTQFTISLWIEPLSVVSYTNYFSVPYRSSGWTNPYNSLVVYRNASASQSTTVQWATSSTTTQGAIFGSELITTGAGSYANYIITRDGASCILYKNGVQAGTATAPGNSNVDWNEKRPVTLLNHSSTSLGEGYSGHCDGADIWNRALTGTEVSAYYANRFQLYAPRRIYIPTATAAATAPTITALSAINITATSAQPRISYS